MTSLTAPVSFAFGTVGMAIPVQLAGIFGLELDGPITVGLARLACASFVGYGVLKWLARDLTDVGAQRAVAAGNATGWLASGAVTLAALLARVATPATWSIVALQAVVAGAWVAVLLQARSPARSVATG